MEVDTNSHHPLNLMGIILLPREWVKVTWEILKLMQMEEVMVAKVSFILLLHLLQVCKVGTINLPPTNSEVSSILHLHHLL